MSGETPALVRKLHTAIRARDRDLVLSILQEGGVDVVNARYCM
jgi:hypothetical protein